MQAITEDMRIQDEWYTQAREMTHKKFPKFFRHLMEDYAHDYGTVCHAIAAIAVAAANAANRHPGSNGGITGFQSGAVMWEFIRNWTDGGRYEPKRIVNYGNLLYPQYDEEFEKTLSQEFFEKLQERAIAHLAAPQGESLVHPDVKARWELIASGKLPEGWKIED